MPSQAKKWGTKPGSSQTTAIPLYDSENDSSELESNAAAAAPGPSAAPPRRGNPEAATTTESRRAGLRSRTKASAPVKQAPPSKASVTASSKRNHEEVTSESDYSSDAIFVATSRSTTTTNLDKGKGKQRETVSTNVSRVSSSDTSKTAQSKNRNLSTKQQRDSAAMEVDGETDSSIERLPTPESLVTAEDSEAGAELKRLLKADRTPVKKASADHPSTSSSSAVKGPSFLERLQSNSRPPFSKTFKGKVRSSTSTSIPLDDDQFRSEEDDEDYESDDRPSSRRRRVTKQKKPGPRRPPPKKANSSQTIDLVDSDSSEPVRKRPATSQTAIDSSSDEDLPDLPGTSTLSAPTGSGRKSSQFKDNLEELNKRRRLSDKKNKSKEKHAKRVVASPSPSPEPVKVVATRPAESSPLAMSSARAKQRINIRAISSKGRPPKKKMPMFRAPSDDSDNRAAGLSSDDSDTDDPVEPSAKSKGTNKKKLKKKQPTPSSSSSSSSGSSAPPDDDEVSEVEEDITLDFNPIVKDKLRPKDNSKAHRLDKLKQARAAKELREERRRKGIIEDSDDEEKAKTAKASAVEEEEEETDSSSSADVENFIVEDDGDIDPDELDRVQRMMPTQFSKHGALPLEDHFRIFVTSVVFRWFLPKSKHYRDKEEFSYSQLQVQNAINGLINGSIASSIWHGAFRTALDERPELELYQIQMTNGCDGCSKYDRIATQQAVISGKPYHPVTLMDTEEDDEDEPAQTFDLGRFCAEKAYFHHSLRHFLKHAADRIRELCRTRSTLGSKLMGDKDDRNEQREKEASRIVDVISSGTFPLQQQLWGELDQLMERAKKKYLK